MNDSWDCKKMIQKLSSDKGTELYQLKKLDENDCRICDPENNTGKICNNCLDDLNEWCENPRCKDYTTRGLKKF